MISIADLYRNVPDEAQRLKFTGLMQKYRQHRRRRAWQRGQPYSQDRDAPPPCVLDSAEPEG